MQHDEGNSAGLRNENFRLNDWTVEPPGNRLIRGHDVIHLEPKMMDVLIELANNHQRVVSKAELLDRIWPGRFVVEGALRRCIFELRRAFDDDAKQPRFIETVPKRGYRLVASIELIDEMSSIPAPETALWMERSPFRGLKPFDVDDALIFFGRDVLIREVIDALARQTEIGRAFVLILGASGSGKSSLARAGVLPELVQQAADGESTTGYAVFQYSECTGDLFNGLATSVLSASAFADAGVGHASLADLLKNDSEAALEWIKQTLSDSTAGQSRLVLLIDQMEELFSPEAISEEAREDFIALIHTLARSGYIQVIATLRSDYYPAWTQYQALVSLINPHGLCHMHPPSTYEIGQMIRRPAQFAQLSFERNDTGEGLDEVLQDAATRRPELLPLLEFMLEELYKRRDPDGCLTFSTYEELDGVEGCVAQRAEEIFLGLASETQDALPQVLEMLVMLGTGREEGYNRKPATIEQVTKNIAARSLVETFVNARLFTATLASDGRRRIVQLSHEALLEHWPRARDWLSDNKALLRSHDWLAAQTRRWESEGRSSDYLLRAGKPLMESENLIESEVDLSPTEAQFVAASQKKASGRAWLKRAAIAALVGLTVVAAVLAGFANRQRMLAEAEAQKAQLEASKAMQIAEFLSGIFEASDPGRTGSEVVTARALLDRGTERIDAELKDQPETQAALKYIMADAYRSLGLFQKSAGILRDTLAIRLTLYGSENVEVADVKARLGAVLTDLDQIDEAKTLLRDAVRIHGQLAGDNDVRTASSLNLLGIVLTGDRELEEAEQVLTEALRVRLENLGSSLLTADTLNNLAAVNQMQEEFVSAETRYREAIEIYQALDDTALAELARTYNNVGSLRREQEDLAGAEAMFHQGLTIHERLYGADHPDLVPILSNIGTALYEQGKKPDAKDTFQRAYDIARLQLADDHIYTALTVVKLAEVMLELDSASNVPDLNLAIPTLAQTFGPESWVVARAQSVLGENLVSLGSYEKAELLLVPSYRVLEAELGPDSVYTQNALRRIVRLYRLSGKPKLAIPFERMLDVVD